VSGEAAGGAGRGSTAYWRRGEGRRRAAATLSRKRKQRVEVARAEEASIGGKLLSTSAAPTLQLDGVGG
jgi:hypothetical protein